MRLIVFNGIAISDNDHWKFWGKWGKDQKCGQCQSPGGMFVWQWLLLFHQIIAFHQIITQKKEQMLGLFSRNVLNALRRTLPTTVNVQQKHLFRWENSLDFFFVLDWRASSFLSVLPSPLKTATTKSFQHQSMIKNDNFLLTASREMNRNARRPKKANHGKRPCNRMRRREKLNRLKSRAHKAKIFGFF